MESSSFSFERSAHASSANLNDAPAPGQETPPVVPSLWATTLQWLRSHAVFLFVGFVLVVLFVTRSGATETSPRQNNTEANLEVLVPMLPIASGQEIFPDTLRPISLKPRSLTPRQSLQAIRLEDATKLQGRLFAKRNLPPRQVIYWNDVIYKDGSKTPPANSAARVIYAGE